MVSSSLKRAEILGTRGLSNSDSIVVYNSSFYPNLPDPTSETIEDIYEALGLEPIGKNDEGRYIFENIKGEGFNTIIFLEGGNVLGYVLLIRPKAVNIVTKYQEFVPLRKNIIISYVAISINNNGTEIRIDDEIINLLNDVVTKWDRPETYHRGPIEIDHLLGSYTKKVSALKRSKVSKDIVLGHSVCHEGGLYKVGLAKNLYLSDLYLDWDKTQLGFYDNDPAIYLWKGNQFSIFSLTKGLNTVFPDLTENKPLAYTSSKPGISASEVYTVPEGEEIDYFTGRYLVTKSSRVLDISAWSWLKGEHFFINGDNVRILDSVLWKSTDEMIEDIPEMSDVHANLGQLFLEGDMPHKKIGDWVVLRNSASHILTYTSMTITLRVLESEEQPIPVNDRVLLRGSRLYGEQGKTYITKGVAEWLEREEVEGKEFSFSDPFSLAKSALGYYRKNTLPENTQGLKILGGLGGLIYYRQGNILNYL